MASAQDNGSKACSTCGHRVPITLRDLFWQDPFFSSNWDDFSKLHDEMMAETRSIWAKFDQQLKHFEAKTPEPLPEDAKAPGKSTKIAKKKRQQNVNIHSVIAGWLFPKRSFMRLPSIFNEESSKDMFKDEQQIKVKEDDSGFQVSLDTSAYRYEYLLIENLSHVNS